MLEQIISKSVKTKAISLSSIGVNEIAFNYNDVNQVLHDLYISRIGLLGGDILEIDEEKGKPKYTYENWAIDLKKYSSYEEFINDSIEFTKNFIENINEKEKKIYVFVICNSKDEFINYRNQ